MWWQALLSVLHDLWCFAFGLDQITTNSTTAEPPVLRLSVPTDNPAVSLYPNIRYATDHPETVLIRTYLREYTSVPPLAGDLTSLEWLGFLFDRSGRSLPWLVLKLTPIGQWHQTLKDVPSVQVGTTPKSHSLMEWQDSTGKGHLAYVAKVSPDETIVTQELGVLLPGVITETTLQSVQWQAAQPVFISVL